FRALDEKWRYKAHELIQKEARAIAEGMGAEVDIEIPPGYPSLKNDEHLSKLTRTIADDFLNSENVMTIPKRMGGEDFAFYTREIPACFYRVGVGNSMKGISSHLHTPTFNVDEAAIEKSVGLMTYIGMELLKE
ncbi:MAG TPA: M20/M25/M40 family metallo-hydrolase, partial [Chitinophagaceae bacterium]|nr:M20/M25/M40 family metallo-hydrolase [Chitinophagaceae bacterium]